METALGKKPLFALVPPARFQGLAAALRPIETLLGLTRCAEIYEQVAAIEEPRAFMRAVLSRMEIRCEPRPEEVSQIPEKGPVVVVANHPFGGIEHVVSDPSVLCVSTVSHLAFSCHLYSKMKVKCQYYFAQLSIVRRSDHGMKRNADIGLFTKSSILTLVKRNE